MHDGHKFRLSNAQILRDFPSQMVEQTKNSLSQAASKHGVPLQRILLQQRAQMHQRSAC